MLDKKNYDNIIQKIYNDSSIEIVIFGQTE